MNHVPVDRRFDGASAKPGGIARSVLEALQNERCLDVHYRGRVKDAPFLHKLPNYKVMKQIALYRRFGWCYAVVAKPLASLVPAFTLAQGVAALVMAARSRRVRSADPAYVVPASVNTRTLVESALQPEREGEQVTYDVLDGVRSLSAAVGVRGVVRALRDCVTLYGLIARCPREERLDLLLHSRDALSLAMLARQAAASPRSRFITEDHYQRWSYLLSHHSKRLVIVQHGFIDGEIGFPNPFGAIDLLCVRDDTFVKPFRAYFAVNRWRTFSIRRSLSPVPVRGKVVFLASSYPAVDVEIALLQAVGRETGASIVVKLHPSHTYDHRKDKLLGLASHVCTGDEYPRCDVFVSFNSFMEYDYRDAGVPTFSIARDGLEATVQSVVRAVTTEATSPVRG